MKALPDKLSWSLHYTPQDVQSSETSRFSWGDERAAHLECLSHYLFATAISAGRPEGIRVVQARVCCLFCLVQDVMWWEGPDFMGRQENVQSFVVSSIGWRKIPTVL